MASVWGRLARQSGIYTLGNLVLKAGGLALLALYLDPALLSQADYGRLVLLDTSASLLLVVAGLGLPAGLVKLLTDAERADDHAALPTTALLASGALALALAALIWALAPGLAPFFVDDPARVRPVQLIGLYVAAKVLGAVPLAVLRTDERAGVFVAATSVELLFLVGGVAASLLLWQAGLEGVLWSYVASAGGGAAVALVAALGRGEGGGWRPGLVRPLIRIGAPLAAGGLASVVLNSGDQLLLKAFRDAEAVAVYGLAARFGGLVNMLFVQSFTAAFTVIGLKTLGAGQGADLHRRTFRHYVALTGWGVLGVSLLARDVTAWLSPNPAFQDAEVLILPIALGFLGYGVYFVVMNVLYATGRTERIAANVALAAALNVALNVALIPALGALGAALTTALAYAVLAGLTAWQAHRAHPVHYPWRALAQVVLLILGLWALAQPTALWAPFPRLAARVGLIALYPPLLLAAGLYSREELGRLRALARTRF